MPQKTVGVKGSDVYDSTGDPRLDLNVKLVRGACPVDLQISIVAAASVSLADAAVMAFHTRNVRGGKGERDLFRHMILGLNKEYPALVQRLIELVPAYGCWRDMFDIGDAGGADLYEAILTHTADVLRNDQAAPLEEDGKKVSISLAAKWAPREGSAGDTHAQALAQRLFPMARQFSQRMGGYRRLLSGLNARLKTVETLMSAGRWDEIAPPSVPGRAGKLYTRAFLNLVNTTKAGETLSQGDRARLRHPDDPKRMACREAFQAHYGRAKEGKAKVHGADTLFPHEVVKAVYAGLHGGTMDEAQEDHLCAVWRSMVEKARAAGGLRRSIFMSDFSGSMQSSSQGDTPYWVSMALGLLGAEVVSGAGFTPAAGAAAGSRSSGGTCGDGFSNRFMTFDSVPTWHELPLLGADGKPSNIFDRVASIARSGVGQGLSTDFQKAMDLVLETLKAQRIRPGEEPENLIVLTDMGWDQACASNEYGTYTGNSYRHHVKHAPWETHVEMIRESFRRAGEDMWGPVAAGGLGGWAMPRIVIWNLAASPAASPTDFHAKADTPGVAMLSGWSPTQFRVLCEAGPRQLTPMEILRIELDDSRYDPVRRVVADWTAAQPAVCDHPAQDCVGCSGGESWGHANGWGV
jgi:hypothetical protein